MDQGLTSSSLYNDFGNLAKLRSQAGKDSPQALKEVAKQFEAIFIQMALKSMREASFGDSLFGSQQQDMYRDMFDKQLSVNLSNGQGIGLADTLVRQLKQDFSSLRDNGNLKDGALKPVEKTDNTALPNKNQPLSFASPQAFIDAVWPQAERVAQKSGLSTEAIVAQAALETGWGKHVMKDASGKNSFNLFGIKADSRWDGDTVSVVTTEYRDGVVQRERASFRSYNSIEDSINDYAKFITTSPRYQQALQHQDNPHEFARALQDAGYATDPAYADKLNTIIQRYQLSEYSGAGSVNAA
jgi:flagellar protein FlgJ